jgi:23S rRNA (adenine2030-N6)-methyltransferase
MFSYRHAFHAGNHADVLKHTALVAMLRHLTEKEAALTVIDTHAGAGLYRLDGDFAQTSGESADGIFRMLSPTNTLLPMPPPADGKARAGATAPAEPAPALKDYLDLVASFNSGGLKIYPGSPFLMQRLLRPHDKLKLFELHPSDAKNLAAHVAQLEAGRQVALLREDGFEGLRKFIPPPARRALVLCDPSYEIKSDYARVAAMAADALKRFATGTYAFWYPIIPRPEAHDLPRRLKAAATRAGKPWLHATLTVKSSRIVTSQQGETVRPGLPASGMFVINPPHTLRGALAAALPQMALWLAQDRHAAFSLDAG